MQTHRYCPRFALLAAAPFMAALAFAQEVNETQGEEIVELSPFTVSTDSDVGYAANSTLAGSRFKTELRDTAASISVLTADFLDDIGATDFESALLYSANAQQEFSDSGSDGFGGSNPNGNEFQINNSTFRVRGQPTTKARNFIANFTPTDLYNSERVESARGPNAVLFGFGSPGGIINTSTKQATLGNAFNRVTAAVESFGGIRGTLDTNHSLADDKFAVRLNLLYEDADTFQYHAFNQEERAHLAVKFRPSDSTTVRAEYEYIDMQRNKPRAFVSLDGGVLGWTAAGRPTTSVFADDRPNFIDVLGGNARVTVISNSGEVLDMARSLATQQPTGGVQTTITDRSVADPKINYGGPDQLNYTDGEVFSAFIEQRLGENTFLELAFNHQEIDVENFDPAQSNMKIWGDPGEVRAANAGGGANPYVGRLYMETASGIWQRTAVARESNLIRLSVSTELDLGKMGHYQIAALADHDERELVRVSQEEAWLGAPFHQNPENSRNGVRRRSYITEGDFSTYYIEGPLTAGFVNGAPNPRAPGEVLNSGWVNRTQSQQDDPEEQGSYVIATQARYLDHRLVVSAGARWDDLSITDRTAQRDPVTNEWSMDHATTQMIERDAASYSFGLVGHVTNNLSLFYNEANNEGLPGTQRLINIDDLNGPAITSPNSQGEGTDIGLAYRMLDDKLEFRINYFETNGVDLAQFYGGTGIGPSSAAENILDELNALGLISDAEQDARTPNANGAKFDQVSEGYEVNVVANLTKNWRVKFNYAYTDASQSNFGVEIDAWMADNIAYWRSFEGAYAAGPGAVAGAPAFGDIVTDQSDRTINEAIDYMLDGFNEARVLELLGEAGHRKHKANIFTRYNITEGALAGAYIGGGFRYQSKNLVGGDASTLAALYGSDLKHFDALIGYDFSTEGLRRMGIEKIKLQLNVFNLLDEDDILLSRVDFDTGNVRRAIVQTPRTWRLQASIDF